MIVLTELVKELKLLRKGRGLLASRIDERIGSAVRRICRVTDDDGPGMVRHKVAERLADLATELPDDLRMAVLAAFALCPDVRLRLYQDRVSWVAARLDRDPRTVRRRIDEGIHHLAQLATSQPVGTPRPDQLLDESRTGWHTEELRVTLALDRPQAEAIEQRRIVADQDGLTEVDLAVTLSTLAARHDLTATVFYGGTLTERGMESSERHAFVLTLPRALARGESHDLAIHFQLPDPRLLSPYIACVPRRPCELFDLRVRFDRDRLPAQVYTLRGAFQRDIYDPVPRGDARSVDQAGEIHLVFRNLTPGLAYGVRWDEIGSS